MTSTIPNPWIFESASSPVSPAADADKAAGDGSPLTPAATSSVSLAPDIASETAAETISRPDASAADKSINSDTQQIVELFSDYARRRCMDKISPPLPKQERNIDGIALGAVSTALNLHPRDLDLDPPPLFLRKPSPAFLESLFHLAGVR